MQDLFKKKYFIIAVIFVAGSAICRQIDRCAIKGETL